MLENAIYSAISPNGAASILWKDASRADEAAEAMKITAKDLLAFQIIEEIIPEPQGGAHRDLNTQAQSIQVALVRHLKELSSMTTEQLIEDRYKKFRKVGEFYERQETETIEDKKQEIDSPMNTQPEPDLVKSVNPIV
jgi:acetyl-CoA carboxylase carboxyl transferase subunit alpha